jgi:hypothetical protein
VTWREEFFEVPNCKTRCADTAAAVLTGSTADFGKIIAGETGESGQIL